MTKPLVEGEHLSVLLMIFYRTRERDIVLADDLAAELGIAKHAVEEILVTLENNDFVTLFRDPEDNQFGATLAPHQLSYIQRTYTTRL